MKKKQTDHLRIEKVRSLGPKEIFGENALKHDASVNEFSKVVFETLKKDFSKLEFRFRKSLQKKEINEKLNSVDSRLGVTIFVEKAEIRPDGGIIEVKDKDGKWRIVLVCEAKHQGKRYLAGSSQNLQKYCSGCCGGRQQNQHQGRFRYCRPTKIQASSV